MNPQPTLQTLPIDCLIEISSYLSLAECMFLCSSSRQLKTAVDEHFRTSVHTLAVLLSARYSPESVALYNEYCQQEFMYYEPKFEKFAYGSTSGVSQLKMYDDKAEHKMEEFQPYFRSENFLTLFDSFKFNSFVDFITKYLPGITKLALIIDHEDHMNTVPTILNLYRKQLRVLFLERTARSVIQVEYDSHVSQSAHLSIVQHFRSFKGISFSPEFYHSIDDLEALQELHFFPKARNIEYYDDCDDCMFEMRHFLKKMLHKLKVLHCRDYYESTENLNTDYYQLAVFKNLEKLICNDKTIEIWQTASFPRLETLILDGEPIYKFKPDNMPSLRTLRMGQLLLIDDDELEALNKLPKLERIHCLELYIVSYHMPFQGRGVVNRSVKFLEIELLQNPEYGSQKSDEEALEELMKLIGCFQGLEKLIVRKPFIEVTGNDLQRYL